MRDRSGKTSRHLRQAISHLAAQLLMEDGELTVSAARRKAAERVGAARTRDLPEYSEIEAELLTNQRIFGGRAHAEQLGELRRQAVFAMQFLAVFEPLLVGPVLTGTAGRNAKLTLHIFAYTAEEVMAFMNERGIPCVLGERRYEQRGVYPLVSFVAGSTRVELIVFPPHERHLAPLSEITGRPMQRAKIDAVRALLEETAATFVPTR